MHLQMDLTQSDSVQLELVALPAQIAAPHSAPNSILTRLLHLRGQLYSKALLCIQAHAPIQSVLLLLFVYLEPIVFRFYLFAVCHC